MLTDYSGWWNSLETLQQIYWVIAFPSTLIFLIQMIMTFVGGDIDDMDADVDTDLDDGAHFFSFKNLVAFFTIFAWSGLASIEGGLATIFVIILSSVSGLIMVTIMTALFYFMSKLSHSGTLQMSNSIGQTGSVYITIPANRSRAGKIQIKIQGSIRTLDAMTEESEDIKTGSNIEVIEVTSDEMLIVKRSR